ncbi:MAG: hypothetical protein J7623_15950 [Chitinophaga sp.]|uniref:hypothetical protein n=1 Tax=Chitinophaga sp. TaxID=1869181 RepID=UPI001B1F7CC0|nr:hypothetical protein [Chitinophaga sp.]MBO9730132.1 hypothetical protein [Chitinophaga sp.]
MNCSILFCSDVTKTKIHVDSEYLFGLVEVDDVKLFKLLSEEKLLTLRFSLGQTLKSLICDIDLGVSKRGIYGTYVFEGTKINLNLKVDAHLKIAVLISVFDYLNTIIQLQGRLYILNRTYLMQNAVEEVLIAINRLEVASLPEVCSAIGKLSASYPEIISISEFEIRQSIDFFQLEGLVTERSKGEYVLTFLGLIFVN